MASPRSARRLSEGLVGDSASLHPLYRHALYELKLSTEIWVLMHRVASSLIPKPSPPLPSPPRYRCSPSLSPQDWFGQSIADLPSDPVWGLPFMAGVLVFAASFLVCFFEREMRLGRLDKILGWGLPELQHRSSCIPASTRRRGKQPYHCLSST